MADKPSIEKLADNVIVFIEAGLKPRDIAIRTGLPYKKVKRFVDNYIKKRDEETAAEASRMMHTRKYNKSSVPKFSSDQEYDYTYEFNGENQSVTIPGAFMEELEEFDRFEHANDRYYRQGDIRIEAIAFEGKEFGREDKRLNMLLEENSPPFQYAMAHLTDLQKDAMIKHLLEGRALDSLSRERNVTASVAHHHYKQAVSHFKRHYTDFILMQEHNKQHPDDIITTIPEKLNFEQVLLIRQYRREFKTKPEIAELLGISQYLVDKCIHTNPSIITKCPFCGKLITQPLYGKMQKFCNNDCFQKWFYSDALKEGAEKITSSWVEEYVTPAQSFAISYYRQLRIPLRQITLITRIPWVRIKAHCNANPNPYSICMNCGEQIPARPKNKTQKYCSATCRNEYKKKMGSDHVPGGLFMTENYKILPIPFELYLAYAMRKDYYSFPLIQKQTGMSLNRLYRIFRFEPSFTRNCLTCGKPIETKNIYHEFCSRKCRWKARDTGMYEGKPKPKLYSIVVAKKVGIINLHLTSPVILYGSIPLYTATILIPKNDKSTLAGIELAIDGALEKARSKFKNFRAKGIKNRSVYPVHDGDVDDDFPFFKGYYYINTASRIQPELLDNDSLPIEDDNVFYQKEGSAKVVLSFFPYKDKSRSCIGCELLAVQKQMHYEHFLRHPNLTFPLFISDYLSVLQSEPLRRGDLICGKMDEE